jgi:hypothetical protein
MDIKQSDLIYAPLWYHKQGLCQTASGYGKKLVTVYKVRYNNKLYRVYSMCYSNVSAEYILIKKEKHVVNII